MAFGSQEGKQADIHKSVFTHYKRNVYFTRLINPELCICLLSKLQSHKNQKDPLKKKAIGCTFPSSEHQHLNVRKLLVLENGNLSEYETRDQSTNLKQQHGIFIYCPMLPHLHVCYMYNQNFGKIKKSSVKSLTYLKISPVNARSQQQKPLSFTFRQITKEKTTSVGNTCYDVYSAEKTQVFQEGAARDIFI